MINIKALFNKTIIILFSIALCISAKVKFSGYIYPEYTYLGKSNIPVYDSSYYEQGTVKVLTKWDDASNYVNNSIGVGIIPQLSINKTFKFQLSLLYKNIKYDNTYFDDYFYEYITQNYNLNLFNIAGGIVISPQKIKVPLFIDILCGYRHTKISQALDGLTPDHKVEYSNSSFYSKTKFGIDLKPNDKYGIGPYLFYQRSFDNNIAGIGVINQIKLISFLDVFCDLDISPAPLMFNSRLGIKISI